MKEIFYPDKYVESIFEITAEFLAQKQIKGLILDIDNTLVPNHTAEADGNAVRWIEAMKASGFKMCIVSNAAKKRVVRFNDKLKLYAVHRAMKPGRGPFLKAGGVMGLEGRNIAVIGDQIFTDIYGGNRAGMYTILVRPIDSHEGRLVRLKRIFEKRILHNYAQRTK